MGEERKARRNKTEKENTQEENESVRTKRLYVLISPLRSLALVSSRFRYIHHLRIPRNVFLKFNQPLPGSEISNNWDFLVVDLVCCLWTEWKKRKRKEGGFFFLKTPPLPPGEKWICVSPLSFSLSVFRLICMSNNPLVYLHLGTQLIHPTYYPLAYSPPPLPPNSLSPLEVLFFEKSLKPLDEII